ncbi:hypothetical protein IscW_ISCW009404 [Ixodes scapularis]|uniref:Uncharacterized protein n=1 Tax=Ixodes scapularis TaxID=6945 RepID=B7PXT5_IXOSC|nr:hypothetical protein IscW_ISCW009404 [Ixodes scapularis]|eukprot:XP_002401753.1 hypothetical protein IscW_ISCW009404 [Ixodes scapularis]
MVNCTVNNCSSCKSRQQNGAMASSIVFSRITAIIGIQDKVMLEQLVRQRHEWPRRICQHNLEQAGKDGSRTWRILGVNISGPKRKNEKESDKGAKKESRRWVSPVCFAATS